MGIALFLLGMVFGTFAFFIMLCLCVAASDRDRYRKEPMSKEEWHGLD